MRLIITISLLLGIIHIAIAQQDYKLEDDLKLIAQTLPKYMNDNPNSPASIMRGNKGFAVYTNMLESAKRYKSRIPKTKYDSILMAYDSILIYSDQIAQKLKKQKIRTYFIDTLFTYKYTASVDENYKILSTWEKGRRNKLQLYSVKGLLATREENLDSSRLDLIHNQIMQEGQNVKINLSSLNQSYYEFKKRNNLSKDDDFGFLGYKLYKPVYNKALHYLQSFYKVLYEIS